jgi:hypothetical protein
MASTSNALTLRRCTQCKGERTFDSGFYLDKWYCSQRCMHDAGDQTSCDKWCGCTSYSKKRRRLREHRAEMRIIQEVIEAYGLEDEVQDLVIARTGNTGF